MPRRRFHIDEHGSLRSGWLTNADPDREPDEADTPAPPSADAGARSDARPTPPMNMNDWMRARALGGSPSDWQRARERRE